MKCQISQEKKVSIYALNYGLCMDENLRWGNQREMNTVHTLLSRPLISLQLLKIFVRK